MAKKEDIKTPNVPPKQAEIITRDSKRYLVTQKGTELPLLQLKGKDYLQVAHRLVWLREEHPDWQIITRPLEINTDKKYAIFRTMVMNQEGKTMATATKAESVSGFSDYIEKAETGATGRAVALCGFGTQFAPEFDEEHRLADSPVEVPRKSVVNTQTFRIGRETASMSTVLAARKANKDVACATCGSKNLTVALTKAENPRNPSRPYWKCLTCPPERSFSHWVEEQIKEEPARVGAGRSQNEMPF
jgi:hypothetical protein